MANRWMVRINGDPFDLELLSEQFRSANLSIAKESNGYYARSSEFEVLSSEPEVRSKADEILDSLNGIGRMLDSHFRPVEIDAITEADETGSRKHYMEFFEEIKVRDKATVKVVNADGTSEQSTQPPAAESQLAIAQRDPKVAKALRIFGSREHDWHNLNNIFEVVQSDVGGQITKAGWATQTEIDRFTRTANSVQAIGDDARHGDEKVPAPKNPMSLAEADALMTRILKSWIDSK
jgi:hypothetical protein